MSKVCKCGAVMEDDMLFCTECGNPLDSTPKKTSTSTTLKCICPHCGAEVDSGDVFCINCGKHLDIDPPADPVPEKSKCPICGEAIETDDLFCPSCGQSVRKTTERKKRIVVGPIIESKRESEPLNDHFYRPGNLD